MNTDKIPTVHGRGPAPWPAWDTQEIPKVYFGTMVASFFKAPGAVVLDGNGDSTI